jgi:hypothetical protein
MLRIRFVLALLGVVLGFYSVRAQAVPGFKGTVNNYDVGMNDDSGCRNAPTATQRACSQWFHVQFVAFENGIVRATIRVTNDSMQGYCGRIRIVVRDRANPPGQVLLNVQSPRLCISGKGGDTNFHERSSMFDWSFKTSAAVSQTGADLFMEPIEYQGTGLDFFSLIRDGAAIVGDILVVAGPIFDASSNTDRNSSFHSLH